MIVQSEKDKALEILRLYGLPINGDFWWTRYPLRGVDDVWKMDENTYSQMIVRGKKLLWEEVITNDLGTMFLISIETSSDHPFIAPKVFSIEPKSISNPKRHVDSDGSLCLFHPSEYNSNMSILEIRNLAATWCFCADVYDKTGKWPADEYKH